MRSCLNVKMENIFIHGHKVKTNDWITLCYNIIEVV